MLMMMEKTVESSPSLVGFVCLKPQLMILSNFGWFSYSLGLSHSVFRVGKEGVELSRVDPHHPNSPSIVLFALLMVTMFSQDDTCTQRP